MPMPTTLTLKKISDKTFTYDSRTVVPSQFYANFSGKKVYHVNEKIKQLHDKFKLFEGKDYFRLSPDMIECLDDKELQQFIDKRHGAYLLTRKAVNIIASSFQDENSKALTETVAAKLADIDEALDLNDPYVRDVMERLRLHMEQQRVRKDIDNISEKLDHVKKKCDRVSEDVDRVGEDLSDNLVKIDEEFTEVRNKIRSADKRLKAMNGDDGYMTVRAYCNLYGYTIPEDQAKSFGIKLSKYCRQKGISIGKILDAKYGKINSYPRKFLSMIFKFGEIREDDMLD